jgi:cobalt-precorrin-5B (C1)-methyltransferase
MQALELLIPTPGGQAVFSLLTDKASAAAQVFCGRAVRVDYLLFDFSGHVLHQTMEAA